MKIKVDSPRSRDQLPKTLFNQPREISQQTFYSKQSVCKQETTKRETMTTYAKGYWTGWLSYLEEYQRLDDTFRILLEEAEVLAKDASHGLTPQGDYWLGYHHGRAAAKTRVAEQLHNKRPRASLSPSPT
jgi:hypothetical protein